MSSQAIGQRFRVSRGGCWQCVPDCRCRLAEARTFSQMAYNIALTDEEMAQHLGTTAGAVLATRMRNGIKKPNGGQIARPEKRKPKPLTYDTQLGFKVSKGLYDALLAKAKAEGKALAQYNLERLAQ